MKSEEKNLNKLLSEIASVMQPKIFNIEHWTATIREKQVYQECVGFLSIIRHSSLDIKEIKRIRDESNLIYQ
jgi:hypothetical protein